jgi:glycine/D-amino acid oxidase-like deaminating enzyme
MTASADIVVAGAGHNSLLTACYLAKAGYRCLVLDARSIPGGGADLRAGRYIADPPWVLVATPRWPIRAARPAATPPS